MTEQLTPEELDLLRSTFDHARSGDTAALTALLDAGADPGLGPRSAVAIAEFFELPEMLRLLRAHDRR